MILLPPIASLLLNCTPFLVVSLSCSLSIFLSSLCLKHTWHCASVFLDLRGSCTFFFLLSFSLFYFILYIFRPEKDQVAHTQTHNWRYRCARWLHFVRKNKCTLIVLLLFSFIRAPLLSCGEAVSLCICKSLCLSAFSTLQPLYLSLTNSMSSSFFFPRLSVLDFPCLTRLFLSFCCCECNCSLYQHSHHIAHLSVKSHL